VCSQAPHVLPRLQAHLFRNYSRTYQPVDCNSEHFAVLHHSQIRGAASGDGCARGRHCGAMHAPTLTHSMCMRMIAPLRRYTSSRATIVHQYNLTPTQHHHSACQRERSSRYACVHTCIPYTCMHCAASPQSPPYRPSVSRPCGRHSPCTPSPPLPVRAITHSMAHTASRCITNILRNILRIAHAASRLISTLGPAHPIQWTHVSIRRTPHTGCMLGGHAMHVHMAVVVVAHCV
jgi:hypothetical protein